MSAERLTRRDLTMAAAREAPVAGSELSQAAQAPDLSSAVQRRTNLARQLAARGPGLGHRRRPQAR